MARKHLIKYYARLVQKGIYSKDEVPDDMRDEVVNMSITLPLREDMKKNKKDKEKE